MKKRNLLYVFTLLGFALASCNPVFNDDSSVQPGPGSSEGSSQTSEDSGSSETSTTETSGGSESESESESSSSSESSSEVQPHIHVYPSTPTRFESDPDYMEYIKGYNVYVCEYPHCGEEKRETVYYSKEEMAVEMNKFIATKTYLDAFEVREDLKTNNYPVVDTLTESTYFGYDLDTNQVVLSNNTSVTRFLSFREKEVNSIEELSTAFADIASNDRSYATIKLKNDLVINQSILIDFPNLFNLDLGGHLIDYTPEFGSAIKVTSHIADNPEVVISNGTIQTKQMSGFNMEQTPKCVYFENGNSLRLSKVTLNNRAERGYGYADYPTNNGTAKIVIKDCIINSPVVGVCIQTNDNKLIRNNINGSVIINGGDTLVSNNKIDTSNVTAIDTTHDTFIDNVEFKSVCQDVYVTEASSDPIYDKYMITSADAILIFDRRSTLSTYLLSSVYIEYNELTVRSTSAGAFGYGIRYLDLDFDPNQSVNHQDDIHIGDDLTGDNNIYNSLSGDEAYNQPGGYYK